MMSEGVIGGMMRIIPIPVDFPKDRLYFGKRPPDANSNFYLQG